VGEFEASFDGLVRAFGWPRRLDPQDGDGKVDALWILRTIYGVATVYNYKDSPTYLGDEGTPVERITDWHIGGRDARVAQCVVEEYEAS
jgi:hypothetical protein